MDELCQWAYGLPYWEQVTFNHIISGMDFNDEVYDRLLEYLLEDAGLEEQKVERPILKFSQNAIQKENGERKPVRLIKISNLNNINKLVTGQSICFSPTVTAIYGANGSGKSSYVRALAHASFARGDKEVLPDATMPIVENLSQSIELEIAQDQNHKTFNYKIGDLCPELASFYVFDATSSQIYLSKPNRLSFSPIGLSYLTRLSDETDRVRERLQEKIQPFLNLPSFIYLFEGESEVSKLITKIESENDIDELRKIAALTEEDRQKADELDEKISKLKSISVSDEIKNKNEDISDLESLLCRIINIDHELNTQLFNEIYQKINKHHQLKAATKNASLRQFENDNFTQIGTSIWYEFIEAAKKLAEAEQVARDKYPGKEDICLLCHQPLTHCAADLLANLWSFLENDARDELSKLELDLDAKRKVLMNIETEIINESSVSYRYLENFDKEILNDAISIAASFLKQKSNLIETIDHYELKTLCKSCIDNDLKNLKHVLDFLDLEVRELKKRDPTNEIARLKKEKIELDHRKLLSSHIGKIEENIKKKLWAKKAAKAGGNTRHITEKYNDLFKRTVTEKYVEIFESTLDDLKRPLKVKIETKGRKGETLRQIILETDPSVGPSRFPLDKVLSDGEKKAVSLADFLTEVNIDESSNGIILDDPVTSLDLEWKDVIASRLVAESKKRQVILFTHDLPFLYMIKKCAEESKIPLITHWIKIGDEDHKPGYVYLNNSPATTRDYKKTDKAKRFYEKARTASPEEQEAILSQGFGALRSTYEAFIIYDLFNGVVTRFEERISCDRLNAIIWDKKIVDTIIKNYGLLSRYMEGHSHSDAFLPQKPTPKLLLAEIEEFEALRKELKQHKKNCGTS